MLTLAIFDDKGELMNVSEYKTKEELLSDLSVLLKPSILGTPFFSFSIDIKN